MASTFSLLTNMRLARTRYPWGRRAPGWKDSPVCAPWFEAELPAAGSARQPRIRRDDRPHHDPSFGSSGVPKRAAPFCKTGRSPKVLSESCPLGPCGASRSRGAPSGGVTSWRSSLRDRQELYRCSHAAFNSAPSGTRPSVANRHKAIRSLRASATVSTRRMRPFEAPSRLCNQRVNALLG
jgi:hypothetical protein